MTPDEYLRRNLIVAKAAGARAAIMVAQRRLYSLKRRPAWLLRLLTNASVRLAPVIDEVAKRRDEVKPSLLSDKEPTDGE